MKLPGISGQDRENLSHPTRRGFLKGVGATFVPKPPISIGTFGNILEGGVDETLKFPILKKIYIEGLHINLWSNLNIIRNFIQKFTDISEIPDSDNIGINNLSSLGKYQALLETMFGGVLNRNDEQQNTPEDNGLGYTKYNELLQEIFGKVIRENQDEILARFGEALIQRLGDSKLLQVLRGGNMAFVDIQADFGKHKYSAIEDGILKKPEDIFQYLTCDLRIDIEKGDNGGIGFMNICLEMNRYGEIGFSSYIFIEGDDYDGYSLDSGIYSDGDDEQDEQTFMSLDEFNEWFENDFRGFKDEIYRRYPSCKKYLDRKKAEQEKKVQEQRQIPVTQEFAENMKFYENVVNGKIAITDEVRERIAIIFGYPQ